MVLFYGDILFYGDRSPVTCWGTDPARLKPGVDPIHRSPTVLFHGHIFFYGDRSPVLFLTGTGPRCYSRSLAKEFDQRAKLGIS